VERFPGEITPKVIRPGSFRSVAALVADIFRFLDRHNPNPKPYRWTADPKRILEKLDRGMGGDAGRNILSHFWTSHYARQLQTQSGVQSVPRRGITWCTLKSIVSHG
jgi:hypothetical protein